ncbi:cytochrome b/b6 domain-containing protein [Bacteroidota bacterium]
MKKKLYFRTINYNILANLMGEKVHKQSIGRLSIILISIFLIFSILSAQSDEDCIMCHEDPDLIIERDGKTKSLYVDTNKLNNYVHKDVRCAECHKDAGADVDYLHTGGSLKLEKIDCGSCHKKANDRFFKGIHGQALKANNKYAPDCKECHGEHDIISPVFPSSRTYKMNIPILCGKCHKEGAPVSRNLNISEHNIIENYTQDIHGKGLFKSGLIVTATCNDCHGNHLVLPHTSLKSSISLNNIAKTCMKCHARIEDVHIKIINNTLWEKKPGAIPACTDCHPPHRVNIQNILETVSDRSCLHCHEMNNIHKIEDGNRISLHVDIDELTKSVHNNIRCVKCHSDVTANIHRPCETAGKVDCSNCHAEVSDLFFTSGHGQSYFRKDENAPYCTDCHGTHQVKSHLDETANTFRFAIPELCGECHSKTGQAIKSTELKEVDAYNDYSTTVHGRSMTKKGLLSAAVCTDCHTTHHMLKDSDERSSVHPNNIPKTCSKCHKGIYDEYIESDHAFSESEEGKKYPTCAVCHTAHYISEIDQDEFMTEITHQCGSCHEELAETYLETYHGKAYTLGYLKAARCSDCHGAHKILNMDNPNSSVGMKNIVATCKKCHEDANARFTGYLTHATHANKNKFPALYYTFWAMTLLLLGVFAFFGIHTLLWLPRSLSERRKKKHKKVDGPQDYVRRFTRSQRATHIFVIISFILLALTGMILKFANMEWAKFLARLIGGARVAGIIHRFAAVITFGYFFFHLFSLIRLKIMRKVKTRKFIFGGNSLMFNKQDLKDFWSTIKWFVGAGPRPDYGRWTYWEKFDYMAVFWGVAVIGFTGLMLWFPEFFTRLFPGRLINVAQIIHSDEALLAVGFIFTIHFFNTHFRPEAFPMDPVIFTGHIPLDEFEKDRPREYKELKKSGRLEKITVNKEISGPWVKMVKAFGFCCLLLGLALVILIIYSMIFGYK